MHTKIAVLTDIHGNSAALKAVLSDIESDCGIEHIYCLGDLIAIGHETDEVLEQLHSRSDMTLVLGNHDEAILNILEGKEPGSQGEEREHHYWVAKHMNPKFHPFLSNIPKSITTEINGMKIRFVHYHLDCNGQYLPIDRSPSSAKLEELYKDEDAEIICFGHHHILHHFKTNDQLFINPGSLGCNHKPIAAYSTLQIRDNGSINCTFKEILYDNKKFLFDYGNLQVPAKDSILNIFFGNQHRIID
jgi:putative phosphoesterase